jgi:LysR family transcriptional regulator, nitrogen assimilation regulatory protein
LILPSHPNVVRSLLDRTFAAAGISPNVVAVADVLSGILSVVSTGMGSTVLPKGDLSDISGEQTALLIEPPLFLTASIISSGDFPLTYAGEAVRNVLIKFAENHFRAKDAPGVEWIG